MTALDQYLWLEAIGIWREGPDAPSREVIARFGNATLLLSDVRDRPLSQWALAGIQVIGTEGGATLYAMNAGGTETLAIRDRDMNDAIAKVSRGPITAPPPPVPERRRPPYLALGTALVAVAAVTIFGPETLRRQAVRMVPPEQTEELGDRMLLGLMDQAGGPCTQPAGRRALERIAARVDGGPVRLHVLDLGGVPVGALPGRTVLLDRAVLAEAEAPAEIAGWIAVGLGRDPVAHLMAEAGPLGDLRYLLTGEIGPGALAGAARAALAPPTGEEAAAALRALSAAQVDPLPFVEALRRHGVEVPPPAVPEAPVPLLGGQEWVALRGGCA